MPRHKSYEAWVECDGKRLEEYNVETDGITVSCWIASVAGKKFRIRWRDLNDPVTIPSQLILTADGIEVRRTIASNGTCAIHGIYSDEKTMRRLTFSVVDLTDDDVTTGCSQSMHGLGILSVDVQQVVITDEHAGCKFSNKPVLFDSPWNEKEAKANSHRITIGPEIKVRPMNWFSCEPYDKDHPGPVATFNFKYRPEAFLRAQGIIAPVLSPSQDRQRLNDSTPIPEPKSSQAVPPSSTASKRRAPERLIKREEQEIQVVDTVQSSEGDLEENELLQRLEYLQKQQAEIQKQQDKIMNSRNSKDPAALLRSLQFWQTRMRETQRQLAETLEEMKNSSGPSRKRVKCEHGSEGSTSIKQEDSKGIIDLPSD